MRITLLQLRECAQAGMSLPPGLTVHAGAVPPPFVIDRARSRIQAGEPAYWWAPFLAVDASTNAVVGGCAFKGAPCDGSVEFLYGVAKDCRRQGIGKAIVRALTALARSRGVIELVAEIEQSNIGSARTLAQCGFVRTASYADGDGAMAERWVLAGCPDQAVRRHGATSV